LDGTLLDDSDFLSVLNDWVDISSIPAADSVTPVSTEATLLSQASDDKGVPLSNQAAGTPARFATFLLTPLLNVRSGKSASTASGAYTICSPAVFEEGITYEIDFLKTHFPSAHVCIQDAKALAKNYLTTNGIDADSFAAYCLQAIEEIVTVAKNAGQPPELGKNEYY
jgi:hypothetical protein